MRGVSFIGWLIRDGSAESVSARFPEDRTVEELVAEFGDGARLVGVWDARSRRPRSLSVLIVDGAAIATIHGEGHDAARRGSGETLLTAIIAPPSATPEPSSGAESGPTAA